MGLLLLCWLCLVDFGVGDSDSVLCVCVGCCCMVCLTACRFAGLVMYLIVL